MGGKSGPRPGSRQADRGATEETEKEMVPRSPPQRRHHEEERSEHQAGQSRGAGGLRATGCSLPRRPLLDVGPRALGVSGAICGFPGAAAGGLLSDVGG